MSQYCPTLLRYFSTAEPSSQASIDTISAERTSPVCADHVRLDLSFTGDTVTTATYSARGCVGVIGLAHFVAEQVEGMAAADLSTINSASLISAMEFVDPEHTHAFELLADVVSDVVSARVSALVSAIPDEAVSDHA